MTLDFIKCPPKMDGRYSANAGKQQQGRYAFARSGTKRRHELAE
jgi:hypothetical protein